MRSFNLDLTNNSVFGKRQSLVVGKDCQVNGMHAHAHLAVCHTATRYMRQMAQRALRAAGAMIRQAELMGSALVEPRRQWQPVRVTTRPAARS